MSQLFEEKRYNDCIRVYKKFISTNNKPPVTNADGTKRNLLSFNCAITIAAEALLEKV